MLTIYKDRLIHIEWTIYKGTSSVREDFTRALVKCFLIGPREKYLVNATAQSGTLYIELPQGLEEGAYSIEAIYVKNQGNLTPRCEPLSPCNAPDYRRTPYPPFKPHDARYNDRCIMRSRRDCLFAITEYEQEEEGVPTASSGEVTLRFSTSTSSYGYDGLSAYEIAVMRGDFNGSEKEFIEASLKLGIATSERLGGIKAEEKTDNETEEAKIDPVTGKLYVPAGKANVEIATSEKVGGIKAEQKTSDYEEEAKIDPSTGKIYIRIPFASSTKKGGIVAEQKTSKETVEVKIDPKTGKLYVEPIGEGSVTYNYTNYPDDEDLTEETRENEEKVMKLADKEYNADGFSGLGRVYLRKNLVESKNVLTQEMINSTNTRYVIQYDYDINGESINIPEGCVLDFQGGSLNNGTINNNSARFEGNPKILNCSISNLGYEAKAEWFGITSTQDPEYNRKTIQMLVDAGTRIIVYGTINISGQINVNQALKIRSESPFAVLNFPDSKGFVWTKAVYSVYNLIENIAIKSKGNCIDFYNEGSTNRPQNVYWSLFRNLQLTSSEGNGVYAGSNRSSAENDTMVFNCTFENIKTEAAKYGFYGLAGNTTYFKDIKNEGGLAPFCNCAGIIENYNGTWGDVNNFFVVEPFNGDTTLRRYRITLIGCNIESFKRTLFSCATSYAMCSLSATGCTFYINHNSDNEIDFYPFNFGILNDLQWSNNLIFRYNDATYKEGYTLFRVGFPSSSNTNVLTDTNIPYKDNNGTDFTFPTISKTKKAYINPQLTGNYGKDAIAVNFFEAEQAFISKGYFVRQTNVEIDSSANNITVGYGSCFNITLPEEQDIEDTIVKLSYCQFYGNQLGNLYKFELKNGCTNAKIRLECNVAFDYGFMNLAGYGGDIFLSPGQSCIAVISMEESKKKVSIIYVHNVINTYGQSSQRPSSYPTYKPFFDTTLGKPIWWNGSKWIDSNGTEV